MQPEKTEEGPGQASRPDNPRPQIRVLKRVEINRDYVPVPNEVRHPAPRAYDPFNQGGGPSNPRWHIESEFEEPHHIRDPRIQRRVREAQQQLCEQGKCHHIDCQRNANNSEEPPKEEPKKMDRF